LNTLDLLWKSDAEFDEKFKALPDNAKYIGPQIQNEMIGALAICIQEIHLEDVGDSVWSIMADECEDISNHQQMGGGI
jgi:hypothetical protein